MQTRALELEQEVLFYSILFYSLELELEQIHRESDTLTRKLAG